MDTLSPEQRRKCMSNVKSKNTGPELVVRKLLWKEGYRYRLHKKGLPGAPDLVFPSRKKVIFIHGCFWHKHNCKAFSWPKSNPEFWQTKILKNVERDNKTKQELRAMGWDVLIVWECETKVSNHECLKKKMEAFLERVQTP